MNLRFLPSSALHRQPVASSRGFRALLIVGLLVSTLLSTNAQTKWTQQIQTRPGNYLTDITYGAGRYVAVGDAGIIRVSIDGVSWKTQVDGSQSPLNVRLLSVIYEKNLFVAVGASGQVITSMDGLIWVKRASGISKHLNRIAYGGGLFMAIGDLGVAITSADGIHWTTVTTGTTTDLSDLVYTGGRFVVIGDKGLIRTTSNGIIWTEQQSGTDMPLMNITAGPSGNLVCISSSTVVLNSADGITWNKQESAYYPVGQYKYYLNVFYSPTAARYTISVGGTSQDQLTSADGYTWIPSSSGSEIPLIKVRFRAITGQFFGLGGNGYIGYSSTGLDWKWTIVDKAINLYGVAYGNGRYVAVGEYPSEEKRSLRSNVALTSVDGQHYGIGETKHLPGGGKCFYDVAFGAGLFVAVGEDAIIQTSTDGRMWSFISVNFGQTLRGITYGGGWFVAVGDKGYCVRSVDGKTWIPVATGQTSQFNGITYANGLYVAVGQYGALVTSPNGLIWTARPTNTTQQLKSVAYGKGTWVAVGYDGLVCWSFNGVNWYNYTADPTARFNHIVYDNSQFVAVSLDGKLYTAPTAYGWTARPSTVSTHLYGLMHGPDQFVAVGVFATVITSPDDRDVPSSRGRQGLTEGEVILQALVYPNPIEQDFSVDIEGASGQLVRLWLVDLQGRTITDRQIQVEASSHQESMSLGNRASGTYLLQVSTPTQSQTVKLLKQ